jgi:hypothetical protein
MRCCFIIFAHNDLQTSEDIDDLINNISFFHKNSDFIVNHPTLNHPKIRTRHKLGPVDHSSFIFGAFAEVLNSLSEEEINSFDHFCLVSANQYFINPIVLEKDCNYAQFLNTENWEQSYQGKDSSKDVLGFPLSQPYGRWDGKNLYLDLKLEQPMASNWECMILTRESILNSKKNIDLCLDKYPNSDCISFYPGYSILMSGQKWQFPSHFGTYDPSNPMPRNWIINIPQIIQKHSDGYFSIKRVGYSKHCPMKEFVRSNLMK